MLPEDGVLGELVFDIDLVSTKVSGHFTVEERIPQQGAVGFAIEEDLDTLEENFDALRLELMELDYLPTIVREGSRTFVHVTWRPRDRPSHIGLKVLLLLATTVGVTVVGSLFVSSYYDLDFLSTGAVSRGLLLFALPLMMIVGIHELAHYYVAKRYKVSISFPFLIPSLTISGILGTIVSIRGPVPSRRTMMDIGFIGPAAGFLAAMLVTLIGLSLTASDPQPAGDDASNVAVLGIPIIFRALEYIVPVPEDTLVHPTTFVGWVGFMVTFFVLLPIGGLDGGYIARAFFGKKVKWVGIATLIVMAITLVVTRYWGIIWSMMLLLILLLVWKVPPPLNDRSPPPRSRILVGLATVVMLVLCFVPATIVPTELDPQIEPAFEHPVLHVGQASEVNNTIVIFNSGNTKMDVSFRLPYPHGWYTAFDERITFKNGYVSWSEPFTVPKDRSTDFTTYINMTVGPPNDADLGDRVDFMVEIKTYDVNGKTHTIHFRAIVGWIEPLEVPEGATVKVGQVANLEVHFKNTVTNGSHGSTRFDLDLDIDGDIDCTLTESDIENMTPHEIATTPPLSLIELGNNRTAELVVWVYVAPGSPVASDLMVLLKVSPEGAPGSLDTIEFPLSVDTTTHKVAIQMNSLSWEFNEDEMKNITFELRSYGNVDTEVDLFYDLKGDNAFEFVTDPVENVVVQRGGRLSLSVELNARGELYDEATLTIEARYGDDQISSEQTSLSIVGT